MSNFGRISIVLALVAVLACFTISLASGTSQTDDAASKVAAGSETNLDAAGTQLAARYHLRKRTSRFFKRGATGSKSRSRRVSVSQSSDADQIAARYHLRGRTSRFFDRVGKQIAARYHLRGRTSRFFDRVGEQIAARYHLRGRTSRFFDRAGEQIAARYHLRGRTSRFFDRAIA